MGASGSRGTNVVREAAVTKRRTEDLPLEDDQQYLQVKYHLDDLRTSLNVCFHNISLTGELR